MDKYTKKSNSFFLAKPQQQMYLFGGALCVKSMPWNGDGKQARVSLCFMASQLTWAYLLSGLLFPFPHKVIATSKLKLIPRDGWCLILFTSLQFAGSRRSTLKDFLAVLIGHDVHTTDRKDSPVEAL